MSRHPKSPSSYRLTAAHLEEVEELEPSVIVRLEPLEGAPQLTSLDAMNVLAALGGPLRQAKLAALPRVSGAPLAVAIEPAELADPAFLGLNAELFVRGVEEVEFDAENLRLCTSDARWLEHLEPGDTWHFTPITLSPQPEDGTSALPAPSAPSARLMMPRMKEAIEMLSLDRAGVRARLEAERSTNPTLVSRAEWPPPGGAEDVDVTVTRAQSGWKARADVTDLLPLRLSADALRPRAGEALSEEARQAGAEQLGTARWLLQSLWRRARTLEKVAGALAARFEATIERGEPIGAPLGLNEFAEAIGMHGSTIARVVEGKTLRGPGGQFPLASFVS